MSKSIELFDKSGKSRSTKLLAHPFLPLIFSATPDNKICCWDLTTKSILYILEGHSDWIRSLAFDPSGKYLLSGSNDTTLAVWNLEDLHKTRVVGRHWNNITSVIWDNTGLMFATGSSDTTIKIWDAVTYEWLQCIEAHNSRVECLTSHPSKGMFASGSGDKSIMVWDWRTGENLVTLREHSYSVTTLVSNENYIISGSLDKTIRIWNWPTETSTNKSSIRILDMDYTGYYEMILLENKLVYKIDRDTIRITDVLEIDPSKWESKEVKLDVSSDYNIHISLIPTVVDSSLKLVYGGTTLGHKIYIQDL
jgi:WD40 repeat protein